MRSPVRLACLLTLSLSSCAVMEATRAPSAGRMSAIAAEADAIAKQSQEANLFAETQCEPLRKREVGWEEEREVGAELAVTYTAQLGLLYLAGVTEKDPQKLISML